VTWLAAAAPGATPLQQVTALRPELDDLLQTYLAEAWASSDPLTLELCRLRIAALHGDAAQARLRHASAVDAGLTEAIVDALPDHHRSEVFTEHQRRCIAYAEQYVIDVHGITDADAEGVKTGMSDAEFVAFTVALGLFDGIGRLRLALGVDDDADDAVRIVATPSTANPSY
jgi:alkylhydroperoxidase family enzyme